MKKITLIAFLVFRFFIGLTQDFSYRKDYKSILKETLVEESRFYYPNLLERFQNNDLELTNKDVLAVMIGFTANENYKPYKDVESERNIIKLIQSEMYQEALDSCDRILGINPVNFTALMERGYASMNLNLSEAQMDKEKFLRIFEAIKTTGTGTKIDPYFVLGPRDGQLIISHLWGNRIGTMGSGDCEGKNFCDILEMIDQTGKSQSIYFNIQHAVDRMFVE